MTAELRKDLILLVPDKNMEASLRGLLSRPQSLAFRSLTYDLFVHPDRDPGCLLRSHDFLRPFSARYGYALVLLDQEGCGQQHRDRTELEAGIEERLGQSGWEGRSAAVVISPELENWVWSDSPRVDAALGWDRKEMALRDWLREKELLSPGAAKPAEPKRAVELVLRTVRRPRSSSIYLELAKGVSTERCTDPAFQKLRRCLGEWFPMPEEKT